LHVGVSRVSFGELVQRGAAETSDTIRGRVEAARARQSERLRGTGVVTNAAIPAADVRRLCPLDAQPVALLEGAVTRGTLSARAFDRVVRVARTIADLASTERIAREHRRGIALPRRGPSAGGLRLRERVSSPAARRSTVCSAPRRTRPNAAIRARSQRRAP
jgi:predicted ATPase with chaperone activity